MPPSSNKVPDDISVLTLSPSRKWSIFETKTSQQSQIMNSNDDSQFEFTSLLSCAEDFWCFDTESLTPSSFLEWFGISDKNYQIEANAYSSAVSTRSEWSRDSISSRRKSISSIHQHDSDLIDYDYAAMHEMLLDSLLEDARHRRAEDETTDDQSLNSNSRSSINSSNAFDTPSTPQRKQNPLPPISPKRQDQKRLKSPPIDPNATKQSQKNFFRKKLLLKKRKLLQKSEWKHTTQKLPTQNKSESMESHPDTPQTPHSWTQKREEGDSHYFDSQIIHPEAILQKDKGAGVTLGSSISARGRNDIVKKLREKIDIMVEVEDNRTSAVLKRVQAVETKVIENDNIVETRSIIGVKMGFLNIKYGVLLHWKDDGMVHFMCLRKMCSSSFMKASPRHAMLKHSRSMPSLQNTHSLVTEEERSVRTNFTNSSSLEDCSRSFDINEIQILSASTNPQSNKSTNNHTPLPLRNCKPLLQPPYFVPRPESFPAPTLEVVVLRAKGLQAKKKGRTFQKQRSSVNPFVRVSIGDESYQTNVVQRSKNPTYGGLQNHFVLQCTMENLCVEIFDFISPNEYKLIGFCHLPISIVEPQPQDGNIPAKEVTLPCKMVCDSNQTQSSASFGFVTLSLIHRNAYICWAKEELKQRLKRKR